MPSNVGMVNNVSGDGLVPLASSYTLGKRQTPWAISGNQQDTYLAADYRAGNAGGEIAFSFDSNSGLNYRIPGLVKTNQTQYMIWSVYITTRPGASLLRVDAQAAITHNGISYDYRNNYTGMNPQFPGTGFTGNYWYTGNIDGLGLGYTSDPLPPEISFYCQTAGGVGIFTGIVFYQFGKWGSGE